MEQFEQIRRDCDREGLWIRGLARRHGVHRRAVGEALLSPVPRAKRSPVLRPAPRLGPYRAVIDEWLLADRDAPRKQRHTAKRIDRRLVDELGGDVAETTVCQYVRGRKRELGWPVGEVFVSQVHAPGVEAEVDWGQAEVVLAGDPCMPSEPIPESHYPSPPIRPLHACRRPRRPVLCPPSAAGPGAQSDIDRRVHAHGLRHNYASELARERISINVIRDALGVARRRSPTATYATSPRCT